MSDDETSLDKKKQQPSEEQLRAAAETAADAMLPAINAYIRGDRREAVRAVNQAFDERDLDIEFSPPPIEAEPQEVLAAAVTRSYSFVGPLPPPDAMRAYDDLVPGVAERLFDDHLAGTAHARSQQEMALTASIDGMERVQRARIRHRTIGQTVGALLAIGGVAGAVALVIYGFHVGFAIALLTVTVGPSVVAMILGRTTKQRDDSDDKQLRLPGIDHEDR